MMNSMNRKSVTKLMLINWSRFQYESIRIDGSTLFTGVNGSGKSTVLDAMTYLLTGNTQFNTAAKDKDRNVKSYVRGDTKSNGESRFLRSGEVISYIVLEFWSPVDNEYMVIGVVIESPNDNDATSSWFILRNTKIEDIAFAEETNSKREIYPKNRLLVKGRKLSRNDFMGRDKAKEQIIRALGMRCDSAMYKKKLLKMMAFNPENNIDQFISECVLEADPIESLAQLREQKVLFEQVRNMYENLLECKKILETVEIAATDYERKHNNFLVRDMMLDIQRVRIEEDIIKKIAADIKHSEQKLKEKEQEQKEIEIEKRHANERYNAAISNSDYQDFSRSIESLKTQKENLEREILIRQKQVEKLCSVESLLAGELKWFSSEYCSNTEVLLKLSSNDVPSDRKRATFIGFAQTYEEVKDSLQRERYSQEAAISSLED